MLTVFSFLQLTANYMFDAPPQDPEDDDAWEREAKPAPAPTAKVLSLGGVPREQKMLKGHLPRVMYHQVY